MATFWIKPGERSASEILGFQIIDRYLVCDRRKEVTDQAHVVIPGQPAYAAVCFNKLHPMTMGRQIIEQCVVRYRDAMRKSRRSAAILQIDRKSTRPTSSH